MKPLPPSATVSIPIWISNCAPSSRSIVTACADGLSVAITPAPGATSLPSVGSIAIPSPSIRPEKTGSGTESSAVAQPASGLAIVRLIAVLKA